ncbi:disease resistance-like protein, partial [Trifolium pratense]
MAMIQPSFSFSHEFTYDVFLSFRGTDTRNNFTGNFYKALCDGGVRTFIDDRELHGGDEISPSLVKAIEESRIFILVFSINYASSSFCLDELVHILHCFKANGCLVLPIFYDVEPSNVRHQTGSYGEALAKHEERFQNNSEKDKNNNMERLHKWKMALNHAANLSGYHFNPRNNGYEYEFIQQIVRFISNQINRVPLHVVDYPVGLQRQVLKVYSLLDVRSNDEVKVVGIYGPGGMGKTTLAKAVYNFIADQFEFGFEFKLRNSSEGISTIKQRLQRKKVLLILDDVDELKQLQALVGGLDWFSVGSRVIITTRDKHLLASHGIDVTYEIRELNKKEALELLRWKTFKGSNLFGKHIEEWNSLLDRYERIPNKGIQKILKVSFDALEEDEQSVFLDIACC